MGDTVNLHSFTKMMDMHLDFREANGNASRAVHLYREAFQTVRSHN